jgi:hypothetical protein
MTCRLVAGSVASGREQRGESYGGGGEEAPFQNFETVETLI